MDPPLEVSEEYLVRSGISVLIFCVAIVGNIFVLYPLIRNFKRLDLKQNLESWTCSREDPTKKFSNSYKNARL